MGIIIDIINAFAKSKTGTKLYKWAASPKGQKFCATQLPTIESCIATVAYVYSTEKQDLDRRRKNVLQFQNIGTAAVGIAAGTYLNKKVFNFGEKIIENLDPKKVPDAHKVMGAIRVLTPIATTALIMRFALPVATAYLSGVFEEHKAQKKKKLDVVA